MTFKELMLEHVKATIEYVETIDPDRPDARKVAFEKLKANIGVWATTLTDDSSLQKQWADLMTHHTLQAAAYADGVIRCSCDPESCPNCFNAGAAETSLEQLQENRILIATFVSNLLGNPSLYGQVNEEWARHLKCTADYIHAFKDHGMSSRAYIKAKVHCQKFGREFGQRLDEWIQGAQGSSETRKEEEEHGSTGLSDSDVEALRVDETKEACDRVSQSSSTLTEMWQTHVRGLIECIEEAAYLKQKPAVYDCLEHNAGRMALMVSLSIDLRESFIHSFLEHISLVFHLASLMGHCGKAEDGRCFCSSMIRIVQKHLTVTNSKEMVSVWHALLGSSSDSARVTSMWSKYVRGIWNLIDIHHSVGSDTRAFGKARITCMDHRIVFGDYLQQQLFPSAAPSASSSSSTDESLILGLETGKSRSSMGSKKKTKHGSSKAHYLGDGC